MIKIPKNIPDSIPGGPLISVPEAATMRDAVAQAVKSGVDLSNAAFMDAYLASMDLRGAKFAGETKYGRGTNFTNADLSNADLSGLDLTGVILTRANLRGANLSRTVLTCTHLGLANLRGVNWEGATISDWKGNDTAMLVGKDPIVEVGPIGNRGDSMRGYFTDNGIRVTAGTECFYGSTEDFLQFIGDHPGGEDVAIYKQQYRRAVQFIIQLGEDRAAHAARDSVKS